WQSAKQTMTELLIRPSARSAPAVMASWIDWLIRHKEFDMLASWQRNLDARSLPAIRAQAHTLARSGMSAEVSQLLGRLLPAERPGDRRRENRVLVRRWLGDLAEHSPGYLEAAENTMRRYVRVDRQAWPDVCRLTAKQKKPEKLQQALQLGSKADGAGQ